MKKLSAVQLKQQAAVLSAVETLEQQALVELAPDRAALLAPDNLPSAQVLQAVRHRHGDSFVAFARAQSADMHARLLALNWTTEQHARYEAMSVRSLNDQRAIEAADSLPFDVYRQEYVSAQRLGQHQGERLAQV